MDSEQLKEKIRLAKEAVQDEPEPFKTEAFKILLTKLLDSTSTTKSTIFPLKLSENMTSQISYQDIDEKKKDLAHRCSITIEELDDTILIKNDVVEIIKSIPVKTDSFKHIIVALCVLIVYDMVLGVEWVSSNKLAESMRSLGIKDLSNLATHLKKSSDYFRIKGGRGHSEYKLTSGLGKNKAFRVVRQLAKNENIEMDDI